ncbi:ANTAR domain-containing protein [Desulfotruncus alcoholivorax]|uniref:hypothetical protein n=1 Tax=Desulfotruncus alcoholivorax TaxID=265477 RepID=UPI0004197A04|nr:hypothetical protein [Desulfotruncus alcoholivorax]
MVYLRVLTATGIEELDKEISNKLALRDIEVVGECYYREGLWGLAEERGADVVVLSPQLPGDGEILEVVKKLRLSGLRVVLLPGRRENETALKLARRSVALGVYDLVWDPVSPAVVVHRIEKPATLAEAGVEPDTKEEQVKINKEEHKPLVQRLKKINLFNNALKKLEMNISPKKSEIDNPGSGIHYEICPYEETTSHLTVESEPRIQPDLPQPKPLQENPDTKCITAPTRPPVNAKIITVSAPWVSGGTSTLVSILANTLVKKGKVAVVDCDILKCGLAFRMGHDALENDWRRGDPPVVLPSGIVLYSLNPGYHNENINEDNLKTVLVEAGTGSDYLLLNAGSNPEAWWFNYISKWSSLVIWVVRSDPPLLQQALSRWPGRPRASCREIMFLYGAGDIKAIESAFTLPCLQVKDTRDKKGITALINTVISLPIKNGLRVLTVGFEDIPDVQGFIFDPFSNVDEAINWLKYNKPDVAIIHPDLDKVSLLEYDLRKYGIPVHKCSHVRNMQPSGDGGFIVPGTSEKALRAWINSVTDRG